MKKLLLAVLCLMLMSGCSIRKMAVNSMADALAKGSDVYSSDEDPELVRDALPFGLKTIESLLNEAPRHKGLLIAAASGFTQYSYAFIWMDSEEIAQTDAARARALRLRSRKMYLRARDYGIRALELEQPGLRDMLSRDPARALQKMKRDDVAALYWTGVAWGLAITQGKGDMDLVADLPAVDALMRRALELNENFDDGAIHEFLLSYEAARTGGSIEKATEHFHRAMELNHGHRIGPLVSFAEEISTQTQNLKEFNELLDRALAFDVDQYPSYRLANLIAQRRAHQLKAQVDELFLEGEEEP